eukprot:GHVT01068233.1.p1 GENE.GHVT01068233.1~~GHVT01068233.1.p1  ORF type:complete len:125 (-),score=0.28 GHVT01068233.1:611-985(-)
MSARKNLLNPRVGNLLESFSFGLSVTKTGESGHSATARVHMVVTNSRNFVNECVVTTSWLSFRPPMTNVNKMRHLEWIRWKSLAIAQTSALLSLPHYDLIPLLCLEHLNLVGRFLGKCYRDHHL